MTPSATPKVRRVERRLGKGYLDGMQLVLERLEPDNHVEAVRIAELPDHVRGYEHLKLERAELYEREFAAALAAF